MAPSTHPAITSAPRALDWRVPAAATVMAVALHALLLAAWPLTDTSGTRAGQRPALRIRALAAPTPMQPVFAPPAPAAAAAEPAQPAAKRAAKPALRRALLPQPTARAEVPVAAPAAPAADASVPDPRGAPVPTYATKLPPAAVLSFEVSRAGGGGIAELAWSPEAGGYTLSLSTSAPGRPMLRSESRGAFDADGLAPERFVDRRRRDQRAVTFLREQGRIVYSGPGIEHPLYRGAQDRLSWLVQLPAIVAADPSAFSNGSAIEIFVAGARGDADVWRFALAGIEPVELPEGRVDAAWRLLREPRRPYDTRVEVWLDPARAYLPLRVRLSPSQGGEGSEFALQRLQLR